MHVTSHIINQRITSCHQVEKFAANNPSPVSNGSVRMSRAESCFLFKCPIGEKRNEKFIDPHHGC